MLGKITLINIKDYLAYELPVDRFDEFIEALDLLNRNYYDLGFENVMYKGILIKPV